MKQRLSWIDSARGLAIVCVYIYHTGYNTPYHQVFDYFLIPIFFFISGYLMNEGKNIKQALVGLTKRLIIPYFLLGLIIGLKPSYYASGGGIYCIIHSVFQVLSGRELWFVACLIVIHLFAVFANYFLSRQNAKVKTCLKFIVIIISMCFIFSSVMEKHGDTSFYRIWQWRNALNGIGYFYLGNLYRHYQNLFKVSNKQRIAIWASYIVVSLFCSFVLGSHIDFASANFVNKPVSIGLSYFSIIAVVSFCKTIKSTVLQSLGRDTLFLFAINIWCIKLFNIILSYFSLNLLPEYIYGLLLASLAIMVADYINKFVRSFFPWLIGE